MPCEVDAVGGDRAPYAGSGGGHVQCGGGQEESKGV